MELVKAPEISTEIVNGTTYKTYKVSVKGNIFSISVVTGKFNYINVAKLTNNPFKTLGKDFKDFDEAVKHYKSGDMKVLLLQIETGLI